MVHIRIIDMPCGYGKSTRIVNSFDKQENYIVVVPYRATSALQNSVLSKTDCGTEKWCDPSFS